MTDSERLLDELLPVTFQIAHWVLGSVTKAEDVVHEGFLRLHPAREGGDPIESPRALSPSISSIVNPDKLAHLDPVADVSSLSGSAR